MDEPVLLDVHDLVTELRTEQGAVRAVDGVALRLSAGESVGLVGESGCGKSLTALSILRLVPDPPARITGGRVLFRGEDLLAADERRLRQIRGNQISMVFQEPMSALNPVLAVGEQVAEALRLHQGLSRAEAAARSEELFRRVGIPSPAERLRAYPHQLSGGMRQRVVLAMALACRPSLLLADEPTTALDVTVQAQILALLREEQANGMALLLITHDLGIVGESCSRVVVLYAGQVVEESLTVDLFRAPRHPYSGHLLRAARALDRRRPGDLPEIPGSLPALHRLPRGCRFARRCARAAADCRAAPVALSSDGGRSVRCLHPLEEGQPEEGQPEEGQPEEGQPEEGQPEEGQP
jgi:peptide/nickel transport system ATP-binding protein